MKIRCTIVLLFCFIVSNKSISQLVDENLPKIISPSPNAASLGIYGEIPVSLFSGLPNISIPIGSASEKDITIPLSLNYHGGGIRPDIHPGWTGLGWDLNCGGVITRKVNGGVDEILVPDKTPQTYYSYYYNYNIADNANWASTNTIEYYTYPFASRPAYAAPDEFIFNFGKYSGSFFLDHKGKWQVRSNGSGLYLKIIEELKDNYSLVKQTNGQSNIILRKIFNKFSITTPDGTIYIFGGTPESIEFSRGSEMNPNYDSYNTNVVPVSWFLTKVISATGQKIDLQYERDGVTASVVSQLLRYHYKEGSASGMMYQ